MIFSEIALARRLERAEGHACVQFAEARRRLFPASGAAWIEVAGTYAVFDGVDSPITQTFGLGIFEEPGPDAFHAIEQFFGDRNAPVMQEVSPFAGLATLNRLCDRGYRPIEISSVLYRPVESSAAELPANTSVRIVTPDEADLWGRTSALGWSHEHPELREFVAEMGAIAANRKDGPCFLAEFDGQPGAAGVLCIHEGVALFGGSATIPAMRRRGLQAALIHERMRYAHEHGCDLAMMVAEPGSNSQRNAERRGFHIAYTRTKWRLTPA